jgi:diguanylate cyclase (GGDEF)-like protein
LTAVVRAPSNATASDDEQVLAEDEQTLADSDDTLSDADQTGSDSDQTSADVDQLAADRDQAASDHDLAAGADPAAHEFSRDIRQRTTRLRGQTAQVRLHAADKRDAIAEARDVAALARDHAADARSLAMAQRDAAYQQEDGARALNGAEIVIRAAGQRKRAAERRALAAEQRTMAAEDRQAAAQDREQAARERLRALVDREALARQLAIAETDPLTGARARAAGLADLDHELDRCRRTGNVLVVAYVDVVGLKTVNDTAGHGAGDVLLKHVVALLREHLRSYDLIIRLGGDEFLCAMSNMTLPDARQRFSAIAVALAAAPDAAAIRTGFAALSPEEPAAALIARADSDLIGSRSANGRSRPQRAGDTSANRTR